MVAFQVSTGSIVETCTATFTCIHTHNPDGTVSIALSGGTVACSDGKGGIENLTIVSGSLLCR